jgi:hypothetical protein
MRKIKFRAWDGEIDQMEMWENLDLELLFSEENNCNIMQYTGLKDVNGVEYFEGDVFQPLYNNFGNYIVTFSNGKFNISDFSHSNCKIIGNIYENKELIK